MTATLKLPRIPTAPGVVRRYLRSHLRVLEFSETAIDEILLAVSEAVTNGVLHGAPTADAPVPDLITVRLSVQGPLLVLAVTSPRTGWTVSPPVCPSPMAVHGRGLFVIQNFTDTWNVDQAPQGTTVYLTWRLPARSSPNQKSVSA